MKTLPLASESGHLLQRRLYLGLTIIGSILPWIFFDQFLFSGAASVSEFFAQALPNSVAAAFTADVTISGLTLLGFIGFELKRLELSRKWLWLFIVCTLTIGVSCALPLFLYVRERRLYPPAS